MYRDFSMHVTQFNALRQGLVLRAKCVGPYSFNYGLAGNYYPRLAALLLGDR